MPGPLPDTNDITVRKWPQSLPLWSPHSSRADRQIARRLQYRISTMSGVAKQRWLTYIGGASCRNYSQAEVQDELELANQGREGSG